MKMIKVNSLVKIRFVKGAASFQNAAYVKLNAIGTDREVSYPLEILKDINLNDTLVLEDCFTIQVGFIIPKNELNDGKYNLSLLTADDEELATISANISGNDNIEQFIKRT